MFDEAVFNTISLKYSGILEIKIK